MDVLCERCGEPWDLDHVQHEMTPEERERFWCAEGCPACHGREVKPRDREAQAIQAALRTVLGDDLDGLAAEMEDLGLT